jgi:TetR/AcrR family transcriptional repressor of nem operon
VRQAFDTGIDAVVELIAAELPPGGGAGERVDRARALFALLMGSLQLARAASDPRQSNRILARARRHALELARGP